MKRRSYVLQHRQTTSKLVGIYLLHTVPFHFTVVLEWNTGVALPEKARNNTDPITAQLNSWDQHDQIGKSAMPSVVFH